MDSVGSNQLPKIVKVLSQRSGRYFFSSNGAFPAALMESRTTGAFSQDNPMVVTSVAAGVLGVIMVILIIFSVWIRRRCYSPEEMRRGFVYSSRAQSTNASLSSSSFVYTIPRVHTNASLKDLAEETASTSSLHEVEVV